MFDSPLNAHDRHTHNEKSTQPNWLAVDDDSLKRYAARNAMTLRDTATKRERAAAVGAHFARSRVAASERDVIDIFVGALKRRRERN